MSEVRQMLAEAFAQDDLAIAEYLQQSNNQQRQQEQPRELVHKDYSPHQQRASTTTAPDTGAAWNKWFDRRVMSHLEMMADIVGEETARSEKKLFDAFVSVCSERTGALRDEIAALREEIAELRKQRSGR